MDEVAKRVAARQTTLEGREASDEEVQTTLAENVAELRRLLGEWDALIAEDAVEREKFRGVDTALEKQRARAVYKPSGARFVVAMRQVQEYLPMIEAQGVLAERLLRLTAEMGPHITRVTEIVKEHPEEREVLDGVWTELANSADAYVKHDDSSTIRVATWAREHSHEARGMLSLAQAAERDERIRREVNAQIGTWMRARAASFDALAASGADENAESE
jgi:hypothetical protein